MNLEKYIEETEIKVRNLLKSNFERVTRLGRHESVNLVEKKSSY